MQTRTVVNTDDGMFAGLVFLLLLPALRPLLRWGVLAVLPAKGTAVHANCCAEICGSNAEIVSEMNFPNLLLRCAYETNYCFECRIINCIQNIKRHPLRIHFAETGNLSGLWAECLLRPLGCSHLANSREIGDENHRKTRVFPTFLFLFIGDEGMHGEKKKKLEQTKSELNK